ncbi:MAG TPA: HAD hydrolase-like protein [Acidimicrobiales bacterium]|nr:HAD hydrolase-like protein [Acidimicrobiales bacterium]
MTGPEPSSPGDVSDLFVARLWMVDLDGVVWLSGEPIGDPALAVDRLRAHGARVVFATNNSAPTTGDLLERLDRIGITAEPADLASSAAAAAGLLRPGSRVRLLAEAGVREALAERGVEVAADGPVDAAVVGWNRAFDFDSLSATARAAREAGRLIGTNEDPTHPTPDGLVAGSGALLAAVATASGLVPEVAGKPHEPMASLMRERFGFEAGDTDVVLVGDQPRTDGRLAERLKVPFALVDSGVTSPGSSPDDVPVAARAPDFGRLVEAVLAAGG